MDTLCYKFGSCSGSLGSHRCGAPIALFLVRFSSLFPSTITLYALRLTFVRLTINPLFYWPHKISILSALQVSHLLLYHLHHALLRIPALVHKTLPLAYVSTFSHTAKGGLAGTTLVLVSYHHSLCGGRFRESAIPGQLVRFRASCAGYPSVHPLSDRIRAPHASRH